MLLQASPFPQTSGTACTFALVLVARSDSLLSGAGYATSVAQNCRGESAGDACKLNCVLPRGLMI